MTPSKAAMRAAENLRSWIDARLNPETIAAAIDAEFGGLVVAADDAAARYGSMWFLDYRKPSIKNTTRGEFDRLRTALADTTPGA